MAATRKVSLPEIREMTAREGRALLDRRARAELHVSGAEFLRRWKAGRYARRGDCRKVLRVAMLVPFAQ